MAKSTALLIDKAKLALGRIRRISQTVSKQRDLLREEVSNVKDILESLDNAEVNVVDGLRQLEDGLGEISKYL